MYDIIKLKQDINRLNDRGNNLNLLGVIKLDNDLYSPYKLYFESNSQFLSISVSVDIVNLHKFNTIEELIKDIDLYYQSSVFIRNDEPSIKINKITPIIAMLNSRKNFDLEKSVWNDDFLITKKQFETLYTVFLSDDFSETTPSYFLEYMMNEIGKYSGTKINDFERLFMLGYNMGQINEIIKSKSIYDIEPLVNINTPEEIMEEYNRVLKKINICDREIFKKCILLRSSFNFLFDKNFNEDQKDVIKQYLSLNVAYDERITSEYSADKMVHVYNILIKNPECKDFKPEYSLKRLLLMSNREYNYISDLIDDKFDDNKLEFYLKNIKERKIKDYESISLIRKYFSNEYDKEQINLFFDMIENGTDETIINFIAKGGFNAKQMHAIMQSLTVLDFEELSWITPEYTGEEILEISKRMITGQNYKKLLKGQKTLEDIINEKLLKFKNNFIKENIDNNIEK